MSAKKHQFDVDLDFVQDNSEVVSKTVKTTTVEDEEQKRKCLRHCFLRCSHDF